MWLPNKLQVDAVSRHAITIAGTAFAIFGLQAKGVTLEQVTAIIQSLGSTANDVVVLIAALAPFYALLKAGHSASPVSQARAVTAEGGIVVGSPALAAATPDDPNIVSRTEAKVVLK